MKKSELKEIIKPIVEECIRDALLSGGLLSSVISEVVGGLTESRMLKSSPVPTVEVRKENEESRKATAQVQTSVNRKKLLNAIGESAYNGVDVFEGTKPLKNAGKPKSKGSGGYSPFEGVDPSDPGVDISALTKMAGKNWKRLAEGNK